MLAEEKLGKGISATEAKKNKFETMFKPSQNKPAVRSGMASTR